MSNVLNHPDRVAEATRAMVEQTLADLGTKKAIMDERMGHIDGSVSARYAHVTPGMRKRLMFVLTEQWEAALDARPAMCPAPPVRVRNELLQARLMLR